MTTRFRCATKVLCLATLAACAMRPATRTPAAPTPVPADSAAVHTAVSSWAPRRSAGTWRYELHTNATVALSTDTASAPVPIDSRSFYTLTIGSSDSGLTLTGTVDSVSTHAGPRIPSRTTRTNFPVLFSARMNTTGPVGAILGAMPPQCGSGSDPMLAAVRGLLPVMPAAVQAGSSWQDTVVNVTCRGDIALRTTTVSSYRLSDSSLVQGRLALRIEESFEVTTVSDSAAGRQTGSVTITGSGTGQRQLFVDPISGVLLQAHGESNSVITVRTRSTALPFHQDVEETITLRQ